MPGGYGRGNRYRWIYRMTGLPRWARGPFPFIRPAFPPEMIYPYPYAGMVPYGYPEITEEEELAMLEEELAQLEEEREYLTQEIEELKKEIEKRKGGE